MTDTLFDNRKIIANKYIRGSGIEIGALHQPLIVPKTVKVLYVDRMSTSDLRRAYPELQNNDLVEVDIIDDGEKLANIKNSSQNFVIANHFIEHCEDPIGSVENFNRVLRPGGIIYLALPDKRFTFDQDRPITPLSHLIRDHNDGPDKSRRDHYEEFARIVNHAGIENAEFMMSINYSIHFHVWTEKDILELVDYLERKLPLSRREVLINGNGIEVIIIWEKLNYRSRINNFLHRIY